MLHLEAVKKTVLAPPGHFGANFFNFNHNRIVKIISATPYPTNLVLGPITFFLSMLEQPIFYGDTLAYRLI